MDMVSAEIVWVSIPAGYIPGISCQIILLPRINMGFIWSENTGSPHCFREIKNLRSGIIKSLGLQRRLFWLFLYFKSFSTMNLRIKSPSWGHFTLKRNFFSCFHFLIDISTIYSTLCLQSCIMHSYKFEFSNYYTYYTVVLTRKILQMSLDDLILSYICCSTHKTKRHVFFYLRKNNLRWRWWGLRSIV